MSQSLIVRCRLAEDAFVQSATSFDTALTRSKALQMLHSAFASSRSKRCSPEEEVPQTKDSSRPDGGTTAMEDDAAFGAWMSSGAGTAFRNDTLQVTCS